MGKSDPRRANGNARRKQRLWLRAQHRPCWICREFGRSGEIDYSLPAQHPYSFEVDELVPVSKWREAGYPSATACALDRRNVEAAHRCCNEWRSNKSVAEVKAIARKSNGAPPYAAAEIGETSRDW